MGANDVSALDLIRACFVFSSSSLFSLLVLKNIHNWWLFLLQKDFRKTGEIDPTSVITPKDPGDIPTFDEWKKKVMEVEKEKSKFRIH